ncbi:MAG: hypothetical protein Kow0067_01110 [Coriobacteriia bacterium]
MDKRSLAVLDASVGVKWLKREAGSEDAIALLRQHRDRDVTLVVTSHFVYELLGVAVRHGGPVLGRKTWEHLREAGLTVVGLDDELASAAFEQCEALGCSLHDALAPGLARVLGAPLYSADARAHGRYEEVRLIG